MSRIELAVAQICKIRKYTESLLDGLDPEDWFRMPSEGVTHIAWQVGHVAVAQYYLTMVRVRGPQPEDGQMVPEEFMTLFGKGSTPQPGADSYPAPDQIRQAFDAVHRQAVDELGRLDDAVLDELTEPPHPMFSTKLEAVFFSPLHEMVHAGQIGLLRRLFGKEPLR